MEEILFLLFGYFLVFRPVKSDLKIEVMKEGLLDLKTTILKSPNITEFTGSAEEPYIGGTSGELLPFFPIDGCSELKESNPFTENDETSDKLRFSTVNGKSEQVIVLMMRGGCPFNVKFQNAKKIKGVVGVLVYNEPQDSLPESGRIDLTNPSNDLPGFLISNSVGLELYNKMMKYRGTGNSTSDKSSKNSNIPFIEITMTPSSIDASNKADSMIQIALIAIIIILALSFGASIVVHMRSPPLRGNNNNGHSNNQQPSVPIDVEFLQKLPLKTYKGRRKSTDSNYGSGNNNDSGNNITGSSSYKTMGYSGIKSPVINDEKDKILTSPQHNKGWFEMIEHDWPMNDSCPICLDEFNCNEVLNELPCGHCYHIACIQPWLQYRSPCCPLCKLDVREEFKPGHVNNSATKPEDETRSKLKTIWNKLILKSSRTDVSNGTIIRPEMSTTITMTELQSSTTTTTTTSQLPQLPQRALIHETIDTNSNMNQGTFQSVPL